MSGVIDYQPADMVIPQGHSDITESEIRVLLMIRKDWTEPMRLPRNTVNELRAALQNVGFTTDFEWAYLEAGLFVARRHTDSMPALLKLVDAETKPSKMFGEKQGTSNRSPVQWFHQLDPEFIREMARVMTEGGISRGVKRGEVTWKDGFKQDPMELLDHAFHHLIQIASALHEEGVSGTPLDEERVQRWAAKVGCNMMMLHWYLKVEVKNAD